MAALLLFLILEDISPFVHVASLDLFMTCMDYNLNKVN